MMTDLLLSYDLWSAILRGLVITVIITVVSVLLGLGGGIALALLRQFGGPVARGLASLYIFLFRGVPLLILLYFLYYGVPQVAFFRSGPLWTYIFSSPLATCLLAFSLNNAAYLAEVVRGGMLAIRLGEIEAGYAIGLSGRKVTQRIVLPLGLRNCLAGIANETIFTIKASAIASVITVRDLLGAAQRFGTAYSDNITPLIAAGLVYVILVQFVEWGTRLLRSHMHGVGRSQKSTNSSSVETISSTRSV
ncbi:amino acid ABC transporter permease protein (plasmid) [Rhizobium gallicum]|uniref:Amino acid ABC transporter permease protein n=1 Tax=Rhizobium gallicum TaxID=56730 RepID=A0A1L5NPI4_9HYPH|nr:ABC transporter permease subunit [Rhizobium gallicum]APO69811.1 amino acid ABC transporter permease protein [Rhizobium gallicum]